MSKAGRELRWAILAVVGVAAVAGIGAFAYLAWQSVTIQKAAPDDAFQRFAEIRAQVSGEPVIQIGADGRLKRRTMEPAAPASVLHVLAYRVAQHRLVRADIPLWFLKLKGPAVRYALRDTGLDLNELGITPVDLERYGRAVVFDETRPLNGDRLLVWTE